MSEISTSKIETDKFEVCGYDGLFSSETVFILRDKKYVVIGVEEGARGLLLHCFEIISTKRRIPRFETVFFSPEDIEENENDFEVIYFGRS